jgi:hypothetical protein
MKYIIIKFGCQKNKIKLGHTYYKQIKKDSTDQSFKQ